MTVSDRRYAILENFWKNLQDRLTHVVVINEVEAENLKQVGFKLAKLLSKDQRPVLAEKLNIWDDYLDTIILHRLWDITEDLKYQIDCYKAGLHLE